METDQAPDSRKYGCQGRDHEIDLEDREYLSPDQETQKEKDPNWKIKSFQEDLAHFNRNKEIILKVSDIPDVRSIAKLPNTNFEDNFEELDDIFIEFKSRYIREKSQKVVSEKLMKLDSNQGNSTQNTKIKTKKANWRRDALRFDDRDFMSSLTKTLKSKRQ